MAKRYLLVYVTDAQCWFCLWQRGQCRWMATQPYEACYHAMLSHQSYPPSEPGHQGHQGHQALTLPTAVQAYKHLPWVVLTDRVEEQYSLLTLPRVRGQALQSLLQRKLSTERQGQGLAAIQRIQRMVGMREEERYLIVGLPSESGLQSMLDAMVAQGVMLVGVYFASQLPLHLTQLNLPANTAEKHVLWVCWLDNSLRLSYWHAQQLYFSRCLRLSGLDDLNNVLTNEIAQTRLYLLGQHWLQAHQSLQVVCLSSGDHSMPWLPENLPEHTNVQWHPLSVDTQSAPPLPAIVWARLRAWRPDFAMPNLASAAQLQTHRQHDLQRWCVAATVIWCLFGTMAAGLYFSMAHTLQQRQALLQKQLARWPDSTLTRPHSMSPAQVAAVAMVFSQRSQQQRLPDRLWEALPTWQSVAPHWQLTAVQWAISAASQAQGLATIKPMPSTHAQLDGLEQVLLTYQCASDAVPSSQKEWQSLQSAISQHVMVEAVQSFGVVESSSSLPSSGDTTQPLPHASQLARIRLWLRPPILEPVS